MSSSSSPINLRTFLLGSALVALIAGLAPYNDYVVGNGFLIACYLPVVYVLCMFVLMVGINAPLRRWWPRHALAGDEMGIVAFMMLAGCSIPCQGMLRSFLPMLIYPFHHGQTDGEFWRMFSSLGFPHWMFPVGDVATGRSNPVATWFYSRVPDGQPIPYSAWIRPLMGWGIFFICLFLCVMSLARLLYPQWAVNERLPFPIAQVESAMIAAPEQGRKFNALYSSRLFGIGLGIAFLLQNQSALYQYFPKHVPRIPLDYDFTRLLTAEPWIYLNPAVKKNNIVFLYLAMGYLAQARVGFSVWASYLLVQIAVLSGQMFYQQELPGDALLDQHLGASLVLIAGVFWVGRHYWWKLIIDPKMNGRWPLLLVVIGFMGMVTWLAAMGVQLWLCAMIVGFLLLAHLVTARIVAETGMPMFRCYGTPGQIYMRMNARSFSGRDVFFAQFFTAVGAFTTRESGAVYVQHGLWVLDKSMQQTQAGSEGRPEGPDGAVKNPALHGHAQNRLGTPLQSFPQFPRRLGWLLAWVLGLSFIIGTTSALHCYYRYATPLTRMLPQVKLNSSVTEAMATATMGDRLVQYAHGNFTKSSWNPAGHMITGAMITALLLTLSLRSASWPLVPVGYILATIPFAGWVWYSVMLGWMAKVLILRFGGAKMVLDFRALFIGLIVGEALAAAVWLGINLVLAQLHVDYYPIILYAS